MIRSAPISVPLVPAPVKLVAAAPDKAFSDKSLADKFLSAHDAPFQNHDALIWPIERAFMTTTGHILTRMTGDMIEVKREHSHIEYWHLTQMGWTVQQLDRFCRLALERALKAVAEANKLAANENVL